jgi:hypothetical protein
MSVRTRPPQTTHRRIPNKSAGRKEFSLRFDDLASFAGSSSNSGVSFGGTIGTVPLLPLSLSGRTASVGTESNTPKQPAGPSRVIPPTRISPLVDVIPSRVDGKESNATWFPRSPWVWAAMVGAVVLLAVVAVSAFQPASSTSSTHPRPRAPPSPPAPPSNEPQKPPPPIWFTLITVDDIVTFYILNVPISMLSNTEIVRRSIVEVLPHFVQDQHVTAQRNQTLPSMVNVRVFCGDVENKAVIVKNVVSASTFAADIDALTGFAGLQVTNVDTEDVTRHNVPSLPPSPPLSTPMLPPPIPPRSPLAPHRPPTTLAPPSPPATPPYDAAECYIEVADTRWDGPVLSIEVLDRDCVLHKCLTEVETCKIVSKWGPQEPWILSTPQGVAHNSSGAVTYMYNDKCELDTSPPSFPALPYPPPKRRTTTGSDLVDP